MYYFGNTIDKKYIDDNLPKFRQQTLRNEERVHFKRRYEGAEDFPNIGREERRI